MNQARKLQGKNKNWCLKSMGLQSEGGWVWVYVVVWL
jgi:hypothetical protein